MMSSNEEPVSASCSDDYTDVSDTDSPSSRTTMSMQDILVEMVKKRRLLDEHEMMLTYYAADVDNYYNKNTAVERFADVTDEIKVFAVFLHFYSPSAYKHIRENFNTPLPSTRFLSGWYENDKYQPGFTKQSFDILARRFAGKGSRLVCSLIADTMQLFIRHSYTPIDVGAGPLDCDDDIDSREAFVILLVSLDENMKIPVGFFIADHVYNETKADLILMTLQRTYDVGVDVVSITQPAGIAERFGCKLQNYKDLKTTFRHPSCDRRVAVFIDPTLCLRSIRNKFEGQKEIYDEKRRKIAWEPIDMLRKLTKETFSVDPALFKDVIELRNIMVKIDLVSELFTLSLAEALQLCKNRLKLPGFKDVEPVIEFITILNTLFDIMFSKPGQSGFKQPMCGENAREIIEFLEEAKSYLSSIYYFSKTEDRRKNNTGAKQLAVEDNWASGCKGFLISIESLKFLYTTLVEKERRLDSIATHRLTWDHLDDFFENFHRRNPKQHARNFQKIYQSFFKSTECGPVFIDRIPIESYSVTNLERALDVIKLSSGKRSFDRQYSYVGQKRRETDDQIRADANVYKLSKIIHIEQDQGSRKMMVGYIAGWVAVQLAKSLHCEDCIDALCSHEKLWFHKYITFKELSAVCLPSEGLFRVCWECERAMRGEGAINASLRRLLGRASRSPLAQHRNHHLHLVRAVVAKYIRLRLGIDDPRRQRKEKIPICFF